MSVYTIPADQHPPRAEAIWHHPRVRSYHIRAYLVATGATVYELTVETTLCTFDITYMVRGSTMTEVVDDTIGMLADQDRNRINAGVLHV